MNTEIYNNSYQSNTSLRYGQEVDPIERRDEMIALRDAGKTLQEIANIYSERHGLRTYTREWVRQIINSRPRPKPVKWPRAYFHKTMKQWLWDQGIKKCHLCGLWKDTVAERRCKVCANNYAADLRHKKLMEEARRESGNTTSTATYASHAA